MNVDVVVVGGGLGGSALAAALAGNGQEVLLLERTTRFEDRVRGEWLAPWGVAEAERLGLRQALIEAGGHILSRQIGYDELTPPDEAEARTLPLDAIADIGGPLCLEHVVTQATLLKRAADAGVDVRRGVTRVAINAGARPSVRFQCERAEVEAGCRLIVGADGRASSVRRQAGIELIEDPVDHLISGLLVEGAHDWPEDLQATGKVGDLYYLVFPQGGGKVRLYADFDISQRGRFAGADGALEFLACFDMDCVRHSKSLAEATPAGPCGAFPSQDAWTERPYAEGVVLLGDAAGYNDPIIGQGQSVTLRDARILRDLLSESSDWRVETFEPYAEERRERLRRLRFSAHFMTELNARFDAGASERRTRARARIEENPEGVLPLLAVFIGPELAPAHVFTPEFSASILG